MNLCNHCGKELKLIFEYKEQSFGGQIIPAGNFCSNTCIGEHIKNNYTN